MTTKTTAQLHCPDRCDSGPMNTPAHEIYPVPKDGGELCAIHPRVFGDNVWASVATVVGTTKVVEARVEVDTMTLEREGTNLAMWDEVADQIRTATAWLRQVIRDGEIAPTPADTLRAPVLLTLAEAAELLGWTPMQVLRVVEAGELPSYVHGLKGTRYVAVADVEALERESGIRGD